MNIFKIAILPPELNRYIFRYCSSPTADIIRNKIKQIGYTNNDIFPFYVYCTKLKIEGSTYYCKNCGEFRYNECCKDNYDEDNFIFIC